MASHVSVETEHHPVGPGIKEVYVTINLLVVIAIIYFAGRKTIPAALKNRSQNLKKRLVDTRIELERYRSEISKAQQELKGLEATKTRILAETEEEGRKLSERLVAEAHGTATRIMADAKAATEDEVRSAVDQLRGRLVHEAVAQAKDLLSAEGSVSESLREKAHESLLNQFFKDTTTGGANTKTMKIEERTTDGK